MARQPPKCCCCVPLRPGLLACAYMKLVLTLTSIGVWFFFTRYASIHPVDYVNYVINYLELGVGPLVLVFAVIFIIGVHLQSPMLLQVFLFYSISEVALAGYVVGWQLYVLVDNVEFNRNLYTDMSDVYQESHLYDPIVYFRMIFPFVVNMLLPIYFISIIKSEVQRLKTERGETRVVLDKPETKEQDKTYNFVYSNETPSRRKPLFPVEELERLRQQMGVENV